MAIDVKKLTDKQLDVLIANHKQKRIFAEPYGSALSERARRGATILDLETTLSIVAAAARNRRFVSYLEICEANGAKWEKARFAIFQHLGDLLDVVHSRGMPLITAIIVSKPHLTDGKMDPQTRAGFVTAARDLGFVVTDEEGFLAEQQEATFKWAAAV